MGALSPSRGELWWYERPDAKRRPVLARKALLTERVTALGPEKMDEVCRALGAATSCS